MDDLFHTLLGTLPSLLTKNLTLLAAHIFNFASPILSLLASRSSSDSPRGLSPELLNAALFVFTVYIGLQILSLASRWVYSIVITIMRIVIFTFMICIGFSLYTRGIDRTGDDFYALWESLGGGEFVENVLMAQEGGGSSRSSGFGGRSRTAGRSQY